MQAKRTQITTDIKVQISVLNRRLLEAKEQAYNSTETYESRELEPIWWTDVLRIDWNNARTSGTGPKSTIRIPIIYIDENGLVGKLSKVLMYDQCIGSRITPMNEDQLVDLPSPKNYKYSTRIGISPNFNIRKYSDRLEDGAETDGLPVNEYFSAISLIGEIFSRDHQARLNNTEDLMAAILPAKGVKSTGSQEIIAKFTTFMRESGLGKGDIILTNDQLKAIVAKCGMAQKDNMTIRKFIEDSCLIVPQSKLIPTIVESGRDGLLINPFTRVTVSFGANGKQVTGIYDKSKPNGKVFDLAEEDGEIIDSNNVHKFLVPGSIFDGIIGLDSVCISSQGISIPTKLVNMAVLKKIWNKTASIDDLYA